jgi:hypothetical protein
MRKTSCSALRSSPTPPSASCARQGNRSTSAQTRTDDSLIRSWPGLSHCCPVQHFAAAIRRCVTDLHNLWLPLAGPGPATHVFKRGSPDGWEGVHGRAEPTTVRLTEIGCLQRSENNSRPVTGLVLVIHAFPRSTQPSSKTWVAGTSPATGNSGCVGDRRHLLPAAVKVLNRTTLGRARPRGSSVVSSAPETTTSLQPDSRGLFAAIHEPRHTPRRFPWMPGSRPGTNDWRRCRTAPFKSESEH